MSTARILRFLTVVAVFLLLGWIAGRLFRDSRNRATPALPKSGWLEPTAHDDGSGNPDPAAESLGRIFERLRTGGLQPGELAMLRRRLLEVDPAQAIAAILSFLATGQDARTGETFLIGRDGELTGAPTFRVMLLDVLGRICREHGSPDAALMARSLLERRTSADEWALALRNIAWTEPSERAYLAGKMRDMIHYEPWRQQPGAGFLEAFDIIVFSRDVAFVPDLGEMVSGEDESLRRAAAAAMDRLSEMAPLDVMAYLNAHPGEFADRPFLRADYYSKADLSNAQQRQAVETYLSRQDVKLDEKSKLLSMFANPGSFVGDTLVNEPPPADDPPQKNAALRTAVNDWLKSNRFPELTGPLVNLDRRLAQ